MVSEASPLIKDAAYYQIKGVLAEMSPEDRAFVDRVCAEVMEIARRSELSLMGVAIACVALDREVKQS